MKSISLSVQEKLQIAVYFLVLPSVTQRLTVQSKHAVRQWQIVITNISTWTNPHILFFPWNERVALNFLGGEKAFTKLSISASLPVKQAQCCKIKNRKLWKKIQKKRLAQCKELAAIQLFIVSLIHYQSDFSGCITVGEMKSQSISKWLDFFLW